MTSSNAFSRFLPSFAGNPSIYQTIEQHERIPEEPQLSRHDEGAIDEENLGERFQDQDLDQLLAEATDSHITTESTAFLTQQPANVSPSRDKQRGRSRPRWMQKGSAGRGDEDDVPESLLLEDEREAGHVRQSDRFNTEAADLSLPAPVPGPPPRSTRTQWDTSRTPAHYTDRPRQSKPLMSQTGSKLLVANRAEKAMYMWSNEENLDNFLRDVYEYYLGKGIWSMLLAHTLELLSLAFVGVFLSFLTLCVDYQKVPDSKKLSQVIIPQCTANMSGTANLVIWLSSFYWIWKAFRYVWDYRRLRNLHDFYLYLLDIRDDEMQTIAWQTVVGRLMNLRDANLRTALNIPDPVRRFVDRETKGGIDKQRMDAHDIANRLMRRENYLIAIVNREILDTTLDIPFFGRRQLFSTTIEWNIKYCVLDFVFNKQGQVKQLFLKDTHRQELIDELKSRFWFAGVMSVLCIPFLVPYLLSLFFLRFFLEFQKNPAKLGARAYTRLAEWKFREFNELWHLFERRRDMSYPFASRYIDQFPKDKTIQIAEFVAFVAGALGGILAIASIIDTELFLGFEITTDRTVIFYLSILGTIWATCRGLVPEENLVFDPEFAIQNVIDYTHHFPAHWEGRLHSDEVRREFAGLYQPKVAIFVQEVLSIIFTPFILWFKLPGCSERLLDFFREFTVHIDGIGYVCSFAVFEFQKGKPDTVTRRKAMATMPLPKEIGPAKMNDPRAEYYSTKDGKMLASYYNFLDSYAPNNPRWGGGAMYREATRQHPFQPPPPFPGISQQQALHDAAAGPSQSVYRQRGTVTLAQPTNLMHASPSPSLLLDPHHQPVPTSPIHTRRSPRHPPISASKLRQVSEDDSPEQQTRLPQTAQPVSQSTLIAEDSHLGDSWRTTRGEHQPEETSQMYNRTGGGLRGGNSGPMHQENAREEQTETEDEDEDEEGLGGQKTGGQGVLGMLYQFQKAQTDGRVGKGGGGAVGVGM